MSRLACYSAQKVHIPKLNFDIIWNSAVDPLYYGTSPQILLHSHSENLVFTSVCTLAWYFPAFLDPPMLVTTKTN